MPRAQNRTAKDSTLMEDKTLGPSGFIIYLWVADNLFAYFCLLQTACQSTVLFTIEGMVLNVELTVVFSLLTFAKQKRIKRCT